MPTGREGALALGSIAVALVLLEGAVRLYYGVTDRPPPHPDPSIRNEWAWAHAHLRAGSAVTADIASHDPELGWRPAGDADAWVRRKGFNLPLGDLTVRGGAPRVLFVGDSFTEGLYVEDDETFAWRLGATHRPDHEIVNLGVRGYGPDQMLLMYEQIGRRYRADVVVLAFYLRGFFRAAPSFTYFAKPAFTVAADGAVTVRGVPVPSPEALYRHYVDGVRRIAPWPTSYLLNAAAQGVADVRADRRMQQRTDPRWALMEAILARFAAAVRADGARPILLVIPAPLDEYRDSVNEDLDRLAREAACALGVEPVSLAAAFFAAEAAEPVPPLFRPRAAGGHFSVRGHTLAAERLDAALEGAALSACSPR